ncbi:sulfite exporter TauE/SafE family protein [Sphingosinicella sp.]|uniref:sulfite exporter TauE/SafE family protein n=1 Tax=Sphingosinicella sp. TaxID=1917971 RepID=UPI004037BFB6
MDVASITLTAAAGAIAGAMNALAGGGTFVSMPALVALGLPSTIANATSNVALQPGAIASAWAYRRGLGPLAGLSVGALVSITLVGATIGSLLLVATPVRTFDIVIPWLLLAAFLVMLAGKRASAALRARVTIGAPALVAAQFALGIYGGYFGGGVGLMMMAIWGLLAGHAPHQLAAHRTLLLAVANAVAAIIFILMAMVDWRLALPMLAGAVLGGHYGARLGLLLSPHTIRAITLVITGVTTLIFFWRAYA